MISTNDIFAGKRLEAMTHDVVASLLLFACNFTRLAFAI